MANPVTELDIDVYQGDTYVHGFTWLDGAQNPINLTGASAKIQFRKTKNGGVLITEGTDADGAITLGGAAGTVDVALPGAKTQLITANCFYDLEITESDGTVTTLVAGVAKVYLGVTE